MRIASIILAAAALLAVPATRADEPKREAKPRVKGVELYSWKDDKGVWQFALVGGTNEEKTEKQVKAATTVYAGVDKLIAALELLAEGERVAWVDRLDGFETAPRADIRKAVKAAKAAKVTLDPPGLVEEETKGVEAYSWKDDKGAWQFALLPGTNGQKTVQYVKVGDHVCAGVGRFIAALKRLPEGEQVLWWSHDLPGFELPAKDVVARVEAAAKEAEIKLRVHPKG